MIQGGDMTKRLRTKFEYMKNSLEEVENRINHLGKRAEVQMQMVCCAAHSA